MVEKILKNLEQFRIKCMKSADPVESQEVSRRLALLEQPFISDCANIVREMLHCLYIPLSPIVFTARTIKVMEIRSIIIPTIGASKCAYVQDRVARIIADAIEKIKDGRFKEIKKKCTEYDKQSAEETTSQKSSKSILIKLKNSMRRQSKNSSMQGFEEPTEELSEKDSNEFVGDLAEKSGSQHEVIERELKRLFDILCKNHFNISSIFESRDFTHVYNFQKHFLSETIRLFMEYVKIKQEHVWTCIKEHNAWILLNKTYSSTDQIQN